MVLSTNAHAARVLSAARSSRAMLMPMAPYSTLLRMIDLAKELAQRGDQ